MTASAPRQTGQQDAKGAGPSNLGAAPLFYISASILSKMRVLFHCHHVTPHRNANGCFVFQQCHRMRLFLNRLSSTQRHNTAAAMSLHFLFPVSGLRIICLRSAANLRLGLARCDERLLEFHKRPYLGNCSLTVWPSSIRAFRYLIRPVRQWQDSAERPLSA